MYLQKGISIKTQKKKLLFVRILKFTDEKENDPEPEQDSLVKGVDPRIRIRIWIRTLMPRIRKIAANEVRLKMTIFSAG
jgi:hypothetical protein